MLAGEPFTIAVDVSAERSIAPPRLGWELRDDAAILVAGGAVATVELGWREETRTLPLRFEAERPPFADGRLHLRLDLTDERGERQYHSFDDALVFIVYPADGARGLVRLEGRWAARRRTESGMCYRTCPDWPDLMEIAPELQFKHYTVAEAQLPADVVMRLTDVALSDVAICCDLEHERLLRGAHGRAASREALTAEPLVRGSRLDRRRAAPGSATSTGVSSGSPRSSASTLSTTMRVIAARVSTVALAMCGVEHDVRQAEQRAPGRSARARTRRARRRCGPETSSSTSASSSTTAPRAVFTSVAPSRSNARRSREMRPSVSRRQRRVQRDDVRLARAARRARDIRDRRLACAGGAGRACRSRAPAARPPSRCGRARRCRGSRR